MKCIPYRIKNGEWFRVEPEKATHLRFELPGPISLHILPIITHGSRDEANAWTWNGSVDAPTLKPSIKTENGQTMIHIWLNDGMAIFLPDSDPVVAGQTLPLLDIEQ